MQLSQRIRKIAQGVESVRSRVTGSDTEQLLTHFQDPAGNCTPNHYQVGDNRVIWIVLSSPSNHLDKHPSSSVDFSKTGIWHYWTLVSAGSLSSSLFLPLQESTLWSPNRQKSDFVDGRGNGRMFATLTGHLVLSTPLVKERNNRLFIKIHPHPKFLGKHLLLEITHLKYSFNFQPGNAPY